MFAEDTQTVVNGKGCIRLRLADTFICPCGEQKYVGFVINNL